MWRQMEDHGSVFGLTRTQKYSDAQLDSNRQEHRCGIIIVGFE